MNARELREYNKTRTITQVCYVTDDYKKTIDYFIKTLRVGPWKILKNNRKSAYDVMENGKPVENEWEFIIAESNIGSMEIEVIQPIYGVNPYSQFLEERGPGIHHIKETIQDNDRLDETIAAYQQQGVEVNYQGKYMEDRYFYLDTFDGMGAYYEVGNGAAVSAMPEFVGWYPEENPD